MLILGNAVALVASLVMVYAGILKKKKDIVLCYCIELALYSISNILLGGIPGAIINVFGVLGNFLEYKNKFNNIVKIILTILTTVLIILFNNLGVVGYLPLICMIIYFWILDIKDVFTFKCFIILVMVLWAVYDFSIKSYVATAFDILTIISTIISIIQLKKGKKKQKNKRK